MNTKVISMGLILTAYLFSSNALSVNWGFLEYDPMKAFTDEDWRLLNETFDRAIVNNENGVISSWKNPASGNSGSITPLNTYQNKRVEPCRRVKVANRSKQFAPSDYTFDFCKGKDGIWRVQSQTK